MIKGIDSQIIAGRTTDLMRDASAKIKGDEFQQTLQSKLQNTNVEKETKTVTDVKKRDIRKTDDKDDGKKKEKRQGTQKKKQPDVIMSAAKINNDSNAVSGNETVGFGHVSSIDIEI